MKPIKNKAKRCLDIFLCLSFIPILLPLMIFIALVLKTTSRVSVIYWSDRIGKGNNVFKMPKFRTMIENTPVFATHLLRDSDSFITPFGSFLRKYSLDELPQLWSILMGDMSFVGPRPALFNQEDLISLRTQYGVHELVPGLTGWAQVNGRDELSIQGKVEYDVDYLQKKSIWFDLKILALTFLKVLWCADISH